MAPSTGAMSPQLCTVIAGTMGWLAPPPHHVRGVVVGSPVRGNGPPLSAWVSRSPVVPSGWEDCSPIRHPAGRVQSLRGRVFPGPKMRPATSLTVFVPTIANVASPAPGQRGVGHAGGDGGESLPLGVRVVLEYLAPDQAADSDGVHEDEDAHPQGHFSLCHSPGVEVILGGLGLSALRHTGLPSGISRPAAGERRGTPRELPRADVAARSEVSGSPLDLR